MDFRKILKNKIISEILLTYYSVKDNEIISDIDDNKFIYEICARHGISRKTSGEYLKIAQARFNQNAIQPTKTMGES